MGDDHDEIKLPEDEDDYSSVSLPELGPSELAEGLEDFSGIDDEDIDGVEGDGDLDEDVDADLVSEEIEDSDDEE